MTDRLAPEPGGLIVRVLPDVSGMEKTFDYLVPPGLAGPSVEVGTMVRIELQGRRVGGWVVETDVQPPAGVAVKPLAKVSSVGPSADVVKLCQIVAEDFGGRWSAVLKSASPERNVQAMRGAAKRVAVTPAAIGDSALAEAAIASAGSVSVRVPPNADFLPFVMAAVGQGSVLVVTPEVRTAQHLAARVRRAGIASFVLPRDWAGAFYSEGVVVGARTAVLGPVRDLGAVVVIDEHDESLKSERSPNWHARDVAVERARQALVPCVLLSPSPSLEALKTADRTLAVDRAVERAGWPLIQVADRRREDPGRTGLFSPSLVRLLRRDGPMLCILNRKGRAVMLACASCGELIRTVDGEHLMIEVDGDLVHLPTGETRPKICAVCNGTKLKRLRLGVNRAREELEALMGEPVGELTADSATTSPSHRITVGTEALLHRVETATGIAFLDFDAELLAPRYRAAEQAMALVIRAARLLGGRMLPDGVTVNPARMLLQTRNPEHRLIQAVLRADPASFAESEMELRRVSGLPPFTGLAQVSGAGAKEMVDGLAGRLDISVVGPDSAGVYLVQGEDRRAVAAALAELSRPTARVRTIVDPLRV